MRRFMQTIIVMLWLGTNLAALGFYAEMKGQYRPPFNFHANLVVAPSPWSMRLSGEIINNKITMAGDKLVNTYDEFLEALNAAGEEDGNISLEFMRISKDGSLYHIQRIDNIPLVKVNWYIFLKRMGALIAAVNLLFLFALYFYSNSTDVYLTAFLLGLVGFIYSFNSLVATGQGVILYYLSITSFPFIIINLCRSFAGLVTPLRVIVLEAFLVVVLTFLCERNYNSHEGYLAMLRVNLILIGLSLGGSVFYFLYRAWQHRHEAARRAHFTWLFLVFTLGIGLPVLLYSILKDVGYGLPWLAFYISLLFFPTGIILINYKYQLLPLRRIFNLSLVYTFVLSLLSLIYFGVFYLYNILVPGRLFYKEVLPHLVFILVLVFLLDPLQSRVSRFFRREIFNRESNLAARLGEMALIVSNPGNIEKTLKVLLEQIRQTVGVDKVCFFLPTDVFPRLVSDDRAIIRAGRDEPLWEILMKRPHFLSTHLLRTSPGKARRVYEFLQSDDIEFVFPVHSTRRSHKAALLIGRKNDGSRFELEEISFLRNAANMSNLLFENYLFQMADIARRRKQRELDLSYEIQLSLLPPKLARLKHFEMDYFSIPAQDVTGDYIDFFKVSADEMVILMGDVTGHGLGPAYLMSASRSIIRSCLHNGLSLIEMMDYVNKFLMDHYGGYEFMTLFAGILNLKTGVLEYINAGHPPMVLYKHNKNRMVRLKYSERLLGVVPTRYSKRRIAMYPGDMLFVYSDGLIEQFNSEGKTYGWNRLNLLLRTVNKKSIEELTAKVVHSLKRFKKDEDWSDDTSFLVLRRKQSS